MLRTPAGRLLAVLILGTIPGLCGCSHSAPEESTPAARVQRPTGDSAQGTASGPTTAPKTTGSAAPAHQTD